MGKKSAHDDEEYRRRRERNNEAVKKSRIKSKQRSQLTQERVQQLQMENTQLEQRMQNLASEVDFLKELLCSPNAQGVDNNKLQVLLSDLESVNDSKMDQFAMPDSPSHDSSTPGVARVSGSRRSSRRSTDRP